MTAPFDRTPLTLRAVRALQGAAIRLQRADLPDAERAARARKLLGLAREQELAEWCIKAVLKGMADPPEVLGDAREVALRQLLAAGYHTCPTCKAMVDQSQVDRIRALREQRIAELERRARIEGAAS